MAVLVAARNEEDHIGNYLRGLMDQDYPREKYSVVVVDDNSTDKTADVVERMIKGQSSFRLIRLSGHPSDISPKINALNFAIKETSSKIILTTDADSVVGPSWISSMLRLFDEQVGVVSGVTLFLPAKGVSRLLYEFQSIDFFSQTACGAGAIGQGMVNNCNGSNMGFRRSAFEEVGGYSSIARVNSGSDSLLAQRIVETTPWQMRFAFEPSSLVRSLPPASWGQLLQQRMRWAGQTPKYRLSTLIFLIASFILYLFLFFSIPLSVALWPRLPAPLVVLAAKLAIDYTIITKFRKLTRISEMKGFFFISEIIHFPVILIAAFGSFFGSFDWKGRTMEREISQRTHHESQ